MHLSRDLASSVQRGVFDLCNGLIPQARNGVCSRSQQKAIVGHNSQPLPGILAQCRRNEIKKFSLL
jgi:hypothetical protein